MGLAGGQICSMRIHRDTSTGFGKILNLPRFHFAVRNHSKRTRTRIQTESSDEKPDGARFIARNQPPAKFPSFGKDGFHIRSAKVGRATQLKFFRSDLQCLTPPSDRWHGRC